MFKQILAVPVFLMTGQGGQAGQWRPCASCQAFNLHAFLQGGMWVIFAFSLLFTAIVITSGTAYAADAQFAKPMAAPMPMITPAPAQAQGDASKASKKTKPTGTQKKSSRVNPVKQSSAINPVKKLPASARPRQSPAAGKMKTPPRVGTMRSAKQVRPNAGMGQSKGTQGNFSLPGQGSRGGFAGDGRPSNRDAAEAIRNAAASRAGEGRISSISPVLSGRSCVQKRRSLTDRGSQFIIHGRRFGASANGRTVSLASISRRRSLGDAQIIAWSDTQITVHLPSSASGIQAPGRYLVGLKNAAGHWVSNINQQLTVCPTMLEVTGQISLEHCAAGRDNLQVAISGYGSGTFQADILPVPGNDFLLQYRFRRSIFQSPVDLEITPEILGIRCPGGAWSPAHKTVRMGFEHPRAIQDFNYQVGLRTFRIRMTDLARRLRSLFSGTRIHLNNLREESSQMSLPAALGGEERTLKIPPVSFGPRTYYINDINLDSIGVTPSGNSLRVRMGFEGAGTEFIGECWNDLGCLAGAPDVQATISVDVFLTLGRYLSHGAPVSISFDDVRVVADPHAQADGVCLAIDFMCEAITNYQQRLKISIENALTAELDNTRVRDQVANALRPMLEDLNISRVNSAGVEGSDFVIRYIPVE
ncbi:MAG TPA: hypothetical protein ENI97_15500 [Gammaproteobacteria bacterium]|nr:hypothetical protein [Gammaproteobacteria bacterium]